MLKTAGFFRSSIGKKAVLAVTGLILLLFVIGHLLGNLQVFLGEKALNDYSQNLREVLHGAGIWIARIGLLAAFLLHVGFAVLLTIENRTARPVRYRQWQPVRSTYASRTMVWSGPIIALFVLYHLAHLTFGVVHPGFEPENVYHNVISGFRSPVATGLYIAAMAALGLHLYHGIESMLQTIGLSHPGWDRWRGRLSAGTAVLLAAGNISIPLAVLAGWVR